MAPNCIKIALKGVSKDTQYYDAMTYCVISRVSCRFLSPDKQGKEHRGHEIVIALGVQKLGENFTKLESSFLLRELPITRPHLCKTNKKTAYRSLRLEEHTDYLLKLFSKEN